MKSPEPGPPRPKTPQETRKENTQFMEREATKATQEITDAEKDILKYEEDIAHSNAVIDVLLERRAEVESKADKTEYTDILTRVGVERSHVGDLVERKEARIADLMRLRDEKTTLERGAHHSKLDERRRLH